MYISVVYFTTPRILQNYLSVMKLLRGKNRASEVLRTHWLYLDTHFYEEIQWICIPKLCECEAQAIWLSLNCTLRNDGHETRTKAWESSCGWRALIVKRQGTLQACSITSVGDNQQEQEMSSLPDYLLCHPKCRLYF